MAFKMNGFSGFASNNGGSPLTKKSTNDPNVSADDKMTADYNKAKTAYLMKNMQYREPTQEEIDAEIVRLKKEWKNKQYQRDRQLEYPNTNDLIVALWEKVVEGRSESADALEVKRQEVKTVHPKPE